MTNQEKFLLVVVLVAAGLGAGFYVQSAKKSADTTSIVQQVQSPVPTTSTVNTNTPDVTVPTQTGSTNTGTTQTETSTTKKVSTTVAYQVPEDTNTLAVSVTLANGIISDVSFSESPRSRESQQYFQSFTSKFPKSSLIGKPLSAVNLSRVGGASLTTNAFNQAISQL